MKGRTEMAGRSAPCTAQEPIRSFVINVHLVHKQVEASKTSFPILAQVKSLVKSAS